MSATTPDIPTARLWLLLTGFLYGVFTLIPDSHSLMVQWPWVAIWQIALLCPLLWLLSGIWHREQLPRLGNGFDFVTLILLVGLLLSSLFAEFPSQARWYSWAVLGMIATLYCLQQWILTDNPSQRRYQLLRGQGYLNLMFILLSLSLWTTQTLAPELSRIHDLNALGLQISFDFSVLELRNWAPLGHQNYVAGYLVLAIPLLLGLGILAKDWQRWLWLTGVGLGILTLYTTSSRGGWLGLVGVCGFGLALCAWRSQIPRLWLGLAGLGIFSLLSIFIFANNRLKTAFTSLVQGNGDSEFAYRWINTLVGWRMGSQHPLTGIGLGNVPLAYQQYRPVSAGRASEWIYQLHSTPAQLWAELGLWGVLAVITLVFLLIYHFFSSESPRDLIDRIFLGCLSAGLVGYGIMSLTDYQMDNLSISGTLVIYLACLTSYDKKEETIVKKSPISPKGVFFAGLGLVLGMLLWLVPVHRAWQLSSYGFDLLRANKLEPFRDTLVTASELAPWEPYYPYQLGWNLGNIGLTAKNAPALREGIKYFQRGNQVSPYQEFGRSNLGWLLLRENPALATKAFLESVRLIPAKRGVFYGLGTSLLLRGQTDLAVEAFALEGIRDPMFITSSLWRLPNLQPIYQQMLARMVEHYNYLLETANSEKWQGYLYFSRGSLAWWRGDRVQAAKDWGKSGSPLTQSILAASSGQSIDPTNLPKGAGLLLKLWEKPTQRVTLLQQAWLESRQTPLLPDDERELLASMEQSPDFDTWVRKNAPVLSSQRQRLGFGVNSRHIDGPQPMDFTPVSDNVAIVTWFSDLFTSADYFPPFDEALQPLREALIAKVQKLS